MGKRLVRLGAVGLALMVALWGWASVDRCGDWHASPAALTGLGRAAGPVRVGAAMVPFDVPYPVTVAGYGPPRSTATQATVPLAARATVVEVGGQPVAVVAVDTLLVTTPLHEALKAEVGLPVWLVATHSHSSLGGYDRRLAAELGALGRFDPALEATVLKAASTAVTQARARLAPARFELSTGETSRLTVARSGESADVQLTRVRFLGPESVIAQWLVLAAHPTLVPPRAAALDPDWPGRVASRLESGGGPVTLVLPGSIGNASVDRATAETSDAFAEAVLAAVAGLAPQAAADTVELAWADLGLGLPRPDGSRLVPFFLRAAAENALCEEAAPSVTVSAVRLGPVGLLLVPFEPSAEAGRVLAEQAHVTRVVSLANGYAGYVEPEGVTQRNAGEAHRQYFGPELLRLLSDGAQLLGSATAPVELR